MSVKKVMEIMDSSIQEGKIEAEYERSDVKGLTECGVEGVPQRFILPPHKRPNASQVLTGQRIPLIDFSQLCGPERPQTINTLLQACREWGFFQVTNHGVDENVLQNMIEAVRRFHQQPIEEKMKYYSKDYQKTRYSPGSDKPKDKTANWLDVLFMVSQVGRSEEKEWPPVCKDEAVEYWKGARSVAEELLAALSEGLGFPRDHLQKRGIIDRQLVAANYYPPCPDPSLTLGNCGHSDAGSLTLLLQDAVGGLQVLKDGVWVAVKPLHNAIVVNLGDQMEITSNGKLRSVEHRVVTNSFEERVSIALFFKPPWDVKVGPICFDGEEKFKECMFGDYMHYYFTKYESKSSLDLVRLS